MSSSQNQMMSVKEAPKKVSAKEKFAAAQAAKMAAKSGMEAEKAAKEVKEATEKAKHDAVFAKEKKKVAKTVAATAAYEDVCRSEFSRLTREQKISRLGEIQSQLDVIHAGIRKQRLDLNADSEMIGKDAKRFNGLTIAVGILRSMI